jgi:hypothetical protein
MESVLNRCRAAALSGALAVGLLASCATTTTAPAHSSLTGQWLLDPAASDDTTARVAQAVAEYRKRMRSHRPGGYADSGGGGRRNPGGPDSGSSQGPGAGPAPEPAQGASPRAEGADDAPDSIIDQYGNTRLLGPDLRALSANIVHAVASPRELEIVVNEESVLLRPGQTPAREYRLGEGFSRFDELGTARMKPVWTANAFELRARYSNGVSITERYAVPAGQSALIRTVWLIDPVLGRLQLHSTYRAAPH